MQENGIILKKVNTTEDIEKVASLADEIWHEHYKGIISDDQIDYMVGKFQSKEAITIQLQSGGYQYYLIIEGEAPVGYIGLVLEERKIFLSKLYIVKEYRGKGLANKVFEYLKKLAKENNKQSIWLTVNRNNLDSIAVYIKKGFIKIEEQVADIGKGYVMDDYIMENKL